MARILIVDDDPGILYLIEKYFGRRGHDVLKALSGHECLNMLKDAKPDMVLLDIMMPGIDGWEVCKMIKEDPATKDTLVTIYSAMSEPEEKEKSFEYAKADEHLSKETDLREVAVAVEGMLNVALKNA